MSDLATAAQALQAHLAAQFGLTVHDKETSTLMKAIAFGMDVGSAFSSGLPKGGDFMTRFATTVGKDVFLPQSIRDNPLSVLEVVTHEAQHVVQFNDTDIEFAWFYLTDASARAQFEADAYASGIAVRCWLTGQPHTDSIPWVLDSLVKSYHLKAEDRVYAEAALKSHMASLSAGVVTTRAAATALDFLNQKYPGLKGSVR
jgi:hypothetical protein